MALNGTKINLDKERNLKFTINAISEFDDKSKTSFFEIVNRISQIDDMKQTALPIKMSELRDLFWCGLYDEDKTINAERAGELLEEYLKENELVDLVEKLATSLMESTLFKTEKKLKTKTTKVELST